MDTTQKEALAEIKEVLHGIAGSLHGLGDLLRMLAERQEEVVKLLTPEPKDGPSLDELLGHVVGQLTELTGYVRQIVKSQERLEQNLPGDVARTLSASTGAAAAPNGSGRDGSPS